jgi:hypothetical protein
MRRTLSLAILTILLASGAAWADVVNARQLMRMVEASYEDVHRAAGAEVVRSKPFWASFDRMGQALEEVGTSLRTRDARFFQDLERGSVALGELKVSWARSGGNVPEVDRGLRLLSSSYRLLRRSYGGENLRARRGGGLTERERQRFERIQTAQRAFASRLEVLRQKAEERRDRATRAEMDRLISEAYRIATAQATLDSYLNTLIASDEMRGEWAANRSYAEPADQAEWRAADQVVEELYVESQVGHVFTVDLGKTEDWSFLDETTENPGEPSPVIASEEIQIYEPSEETVFADPMESMEEVEVFEEPFEEDAVLSEEIIEDEPAVAPAEEVPAAEEIPEELPAEAEEVGVDEAAPEEIPILEEDLPVEDVEVVIEGEDTAPESPEEPALPPPMG